MIKLTARLLLTLIPFSAYASPNINSVDGIVASNSVISISGSAFGKNGPNIVLFDDFSSGALENELLPEKAIIGSWPQNNGRLYKDSFLSGGQGARMITENGHVINRFIFSSPASEVFISSIAYVPKGYRFPTSETLEAMPPISALKHHWFYYGPKGYSTYGHDNFGPNWTGANWLTITSNKSKTYVYQRWGSPGWEWGKPVRWTHWLKGNGMDSNGTLGYFQGITSTNQIVEEYNETNMDGKVWFVPDWEADGMPFAWDRLSIPGYIRSGSSFPEDNYVIDDVYLAIGPNSAARVEIGNSPTYKSATKLAISTIETWTENEITTRIRQGGFSEGEEVFIFVIDNQNNPSVGFGPFTMQIVRGGELISPLNFIIIEPFAK